MFDCLIIGGGVIGLSLAWEMVRQGQKVCLIDRQNPGRATSWAGAGILPPAPPQGDRTPLDGLARLSSELHPRWAAELREATGIDNGYRTCGGIYLALDEDEARSLARSCEQWREQGIEVESLSPDALQQVEPALLPVGGANCPIGRLYRLPAESQIRNPRHLAALQVACTRWGGDIRPGVAAEGFDLAGERLTAVHTSAGTIRAGRTCFTAGTWTGTLAVRCPAPPFSNIVNHGLRYLVPRSDGRVLVGATQEEAGFDCRTTAAGVSSLLQMAVRLAPVLADAEIEKCWAGLRPGTADGLPYLGRLGDLENAFVAAGHFRSGLWLSPGTAVLLRQLMLGEEPQADLAPFSALRERK